MANEYNRERIEAQRFIVQRSAVEILNGALPEHELSEYAKHNFLATVQIIGFDEGEQFQEILNRGKAKIIVPEGFSPSELEPIAATIDLRSIGQRVPVAFLGPSIWTHQEYYIPGSFIRMDPRIFRETRIAVEQICKLSENSS